MPRIETIEQRTTPGGGLGAGPNARAQEVYNPGRALQTLASGVAQFGEGIERRKDEKTAEEEKALAEAARYEGPVAAARAKREIDNYTKELDEAGDYADPADRTKKITEHANSVFARVQTENANNKFTQSYLKGQVGADVVNATDDAIGYEAATNVINRQKVAQEAIDLSVANVASNPTQFERWKENGMQALASAIKDPRKFATASKQLDAQFSQAYIASQISTPQGAQGVIDSIDAYFGRGTPAGEKVSNTEANLLLQATMDYSEDKTPWTSDEKIKFTELAMSGQGTSVKVVDGKRVIAPASSEGVKLHPAYKPYMASPEAMLSLKGQAEAVINKADNKNKDAINYQKTIAKQAIDDRRAALNNGEPVSLDSIEAYKFAYGEAEGEINYKKDLVYQQGAGDIQALKTATPEKRVEILEKNRIPEGTTANREALNAKWGAIATINDQQLRAIKADPGAYVMENFDTVKKSAEAYEQEASPENLRALTSAVFTAQDTLGVTANNRKLPKQLVTGIAEQFTAQLQKTPADAVNYIVQTTSQLGSEPAALAQIANETGVAGKLAINGASASTVQRYFASSAPDVVAASKKQHGDLSKKVMQVMAPINRTLDMQGANKTKADYIKAVEVIAYDRMNKGEPEAEAVKNAYNEVIAGRYDTYDTFRVDKKYGDTLSVVDGFDYYKNAVLTGNDIFVAIDPSLNDPEFQRTMKLKTIKRSAYWVNDTAGNGLMLVGGDGKNVLDANGKQIGLTFDQAIKYGNDADVQQQRIDEQSRQMRRK